MHVNKQLLLGRIGAKGAELRYNAHGTPYCSLTLEIDKAGKDGPIYTNYHRIEITGRFSEELAVTLDPGDEILVEGEHQYRSTIDPKTQQKKTTCVLSTWGIQQRIPALASVSVDARLESDVAAEPSDEGSGRAAIKPRKPRYPKWRPDSSN
jgi:single-stranded DNA-binding protein